MSARVDATSSAGAVGPSAARTASPGIRWSMRNDAVTSTHSDTSRRPRRRTPNRTHGWERTPTRGAGATELANDMRDLSSLRQHPDAGRNQRAGHLELGAVAERLHDVVGERDDVGGGEQCRLGLEPRVATVGALHLAGGSGVVGVVLVVDPGE